MTPHYRLNRVAQIVQESSLDADTKKQALQDLGWVMDRVEKMMAALMTVEIREV